MMKRIALTTASALTALMLAPILPGQQAQAQMTMTLESAGRGDGVSAIVASYEHAIEIPQEAMAARASARRVHTPFMVRKRVDRATPLLYRAMTASETIPAVRIRVPTSRARAGEPVIITLTNARIVSIQSGSRADETLAHEQIAFVYERITWSSDDGTLEHTDDWIAARNN